MRQKRLVKKSDKKLAKKSNKKWVEKSNKKSCENSDKKLEGNNWDEKSHKNRLRRMKLTFNLYKVSQDKLKQKSRIGKVNKIS